MGLDAGVEIDGAVGEEGVEGNAKICSKILNVFNWAA